MPQPREKKLYKLPEYDSWIVQDHADHLVKPLYAS
jgi:hypothetical protein